MRLGEGAKFSCVFMFGSGGQRVAVILFRGNRIGSNFNADPARCRICLGPHRHDVAVVDYHQEWVKPASDSTLNAFPLG